MSLDNENAIQKEQTRIKSIIERESLDSLLETYVEGLDVLTGKLASLREFVEIKKVAGSPDWTEIGALCDEAESELLGFLRTIDESNVSEYAQALDSMVDDYLREVEANLRLENAEKRLDGKSAADIFKEWGVNFSEEEADVLSAKAMKNFDVGEIRKIDRNMRILDRINPSLRSALFGVGANFDKRQIAYQLANNVLRESNHAFLLGEVDAVISREYERVKNKLSELNEEYESLRKEEELAVKSLADHTKNEADIKTVNEDLEKLGEIKEKKDLWMEEFSMFRESELQLDLALSVFLFENLRADGMEMEANRVLLRIYERYGNLQELDEHLYDEYFIALAKLIVSGELSDFERNLHLGGTAYGLSRDGNAYTREKAYELALEGLDQHYVFDILDQLRFENREAEFHIEEYVSPKPVEGLLVLSENVPLRQGPPPLSEANAQRWVSRSGEESRIYPAGKLNPVENLSDLVLPGGLEYQGVYITPEAKKLLESEAPQGMTLVLKRPIEALKISAPYGEFLGADVKGSFRGAWQEIRFVEFDTLNAEDLAYASIEGDKLTVSPAADQEDALTSIFSIKNLDRTRAEDLNNVSRILDMDPVVSSVIQSASVVMMSLTNLSELFSAGLKGDKTDGFVEFAREQAGPVLNVLNNANLNDIKARLELLKKFDTGLMEGEDEAILQSRIDALESFVDILENGQIRNIAETILDESVFREDNWENWLKFEGPKFMAALAMGVMATTTIVLTFGEATPLWAIAAAGAAGGIAGHELGAEAMYHLFQNLDADVREGRLRYGNRSLLGKYLASEKIFDPETGEYIEMSFLSDVTLPYAQNFIISFISTFAALGLGHIAARKLSIMAQQSSWIQGVIANKPLVENIAKKMAAIRVHSDKVAEYGFFRRVGVEILDELKDEAGEAAVAGALNTIDEKLGFISTFLLITAKGFRPIGNAGTDLSFEYSESDASKVVEKLKSEGFDIQSVSSNGVIEVKGFGGELVTLNPSQRDTFEYSYSPELLAQFEAPKTDQERMDLIDAFKDLISGSEEDSSHGSLPREKAYIAGKIFADLSAAMDVSHERFCEVFKIYQSAGVSSMSMRMGVGERESAAGLLLSSTFHDVTNAMAFATSFAEKFPKIKKLLESAKEGFLRYSQNPSDEAFYVRESFQTLLNAGFSGKEVESDLDPNESDIIFAPHNMVRSVLMNFYQNARHVSEEKGMKDSMRFKIYASRSGDYIDVFIYDNLPGFGQDQLMSLFDQQIETTNKYGHGTGLARIKSQMESIGGSVDSYHLVDIDGKKAWVSKSPGKKPEELKDPISEVVPKLPDYATKAFRLRFPVSEG